MPLQFTRCLLAAAAAATEAPGPLQKAAAACRQLQQLHSSSSSSSSSRQEWAGWRPARTCPQHADHQFRHQQHSWPPSARCSSSSSSSSSTQLGSWQPPPLLGALSSGLGTLGSPLLPPAPAHNCCWRRLVHSNNTNRPGPASPRRPQGQAQPAADASRALPRHNRLIRAPRLMVVRPDGSSQLMELAAARAEAAAHGLDLVEVNPRGVPPVAKIMSFGDVMKKHDQAGKARRLQEKLATPKEMQFSARIADHDLEVKLRKVASWLQQGYRVQLVVKHGREEEAAAQEALEYLLVRVQSQFSVEAGGRQVQRRAVSCVIKPAAAAKQQRQPASATQPEES